MNELYEKLTYARSLILGMCELNEEEERYENRKKPFIPSQRYNKEEKANIKKTIMITILSSVLIIIVLSIFPILMELLFIRPEDTTADIVFSIAWSLIQIIFLVGFIAGIVCLIIVVAQKSNESSVKHTNERIKAKNQQILANNQMIEQQNQELEVEISKIRDRKLAVSQEYQRNVLTWFPKDYGYLEAVNYFMQLVENHRVDTIREAVDLYDTYVYRKEMTLKQDAMLNNQIVTINNQKVLISKQDNLVRQQMVGNMINVANMATNMMNLATNQAIGTDVNRMAGAANRTANSVQSINRKL